MNKIIPLLLFQKYIYLRSDKANTKLYLNIFISTKICKHLIPAYQVFSNIVLVSDAHTSSVKKCILGTSKH